VFGTAGGGAYLFGGQHVSLHPETLGFTSITREPSRAAVGELLQRDARLYIEINFDETHRPYPEPPAGATVEVPPFLPDIPEAREELAALQLAIERMDVAAGAVLDALDRSGRAENAIVVFTTDHGLAMPRAKCTLYDPGIEVALIMRWPGRAAGWPDLPSTSTCGHLWTRGLDIPTVRRPLAARRCRWADAIFAEKTFHSYYDPMRCIRTDAQAHPQFETAFAVEVPGDIQAGAIFRADPSRYSTDRPNIVELYDLEADRWRDQPGRPSRGPRSRARAQRAAVALDA
jgi:hypothetical protein